MPSPKGSHPESMLFMRRTPPMAISRSAVDPTIGQWDGGAK